MKHWHDEYMLTVRTSETVLLYILTFLCCFKYFFFCCSDVFKADDDYLENEDKYKELKKGEFLWFVLQARVSF